jgi:hypothetical protein
MSHRSPRRRIPHTAFRTPRRIPPACSTPCVSTVVALSDFSALEDLHLVDASVSRCAVRVSVREVLSLKALLRGRVRTITHRIRACVGLPSLGLVPLRSCLRVGLLRPDRKSALHSSIPDSTAPWRFVGCSHQFLGRNSLRAVSGSAFAPCDAVALAGSGINCLRSRTCEASRSHRCRWFVASRLVRRPFERRRSRFAALLEEPCGSWSAARARLRSPGGYQACFPDDEPDGHPAVRFEHRVRYSSNSVCSEWKLLPEPFASVGSRPTVRRRAHVRALSRPTASRRGVLGLLPWGF